MKPFVKRQKNDAADAAAIAEAAMRPNLHYVAVKSAEHQARAVRLKPPSSSTSMASTTHAAVIHIWPVSARSRSKPGWRNELGDRHKTDTSPLKREVRLGRRKGSISLMI